MARPTKSRSDLLAHAREELRTARVLAGLARRATHEAERTYQTQKRATLAGDLELAEQARRANERALGRARGLGARARRTIDDALAARRAAHALGRRQ